MNETARSSGCEWQRLELVMLPRFRVNFEPKNESIFDIFDTFLRPIIADADSGVSDKQNDVGSFFKADSGERLDGETGSSMVFIWVTSPMNCRRWETRI